MASGVDRGARTMDLREAFYSDYKTALKAGEKLKVSTLRLVLAECKNAEIAKKAPLSQEEVIAVLSREARKRREAIGEFTRGGRTDLVDKESIELSIIEAYLPDKVSEEEIRRMAEEVVRELGASSQKDLGKVMSELMPRLKGRADGGQVNLMVRQMLQG